MVSTQLVGWDSLRLYLEVCRIGKIGLLPKKIQKSLWVYWESLLDNTKNKIHQQLLGSQGTACSLWGNEDQPQFQQSLDFSEQQQVNMNNI
jgi:hypothetical protein